MRHKSSKSSLFRSSTYITINISNKSVLINQCTKYRANDKWASKYMVLLNLFKSSLNNTRTMCSLLRNMDSTGKWINKLNQLLYVKQTHFNLKQWFCVMLFQSWINMQHKRGFRWLNTCRKGPITVYKQMQESWQIIMLNGEHYIKVSGIFSDFNLNFLYKKK